MHCIHSADLASVISDHGPAILVGQHSVAPEAVNDYWISSRNRFDLWHQTMARYRDADNSGDSHSLRLWWIDHVIVLEEVLVTEMLTRVIAAMALGMELNRNDEEVSPVTHAIHLTHLEARNRVQQIMLSGRGNSVQDAVRLNRLRQAVECWTDQMIGRLCTANEEPLQYAINPRRAAAYAEEARAQSYGRERKVAAWLLNASMQAMLHQRTSRITALPEANRAVGNSVMMMLRPDLFDSVGTFKSLWMHRLQQNTERTDRVLKELKSLNIDHAKVSDGIEMTHSSFFSRWYL